MDFREGQSIYLQIVEYVCEQILLKQWPLGTKIISIRDLAVAMEVNPNTVQRAYEFLQVRQIISNKRGVGYFIEANAIELVKAFRKEQFIENELAVVFRNMYLLNIDLEEIKARYEKFIEQNFKKQIMMIRRKIAIKLSTAIITMLVILLVASVFATELVLKNEYGKRDKNDIYWNYDKILQKPYKYLKIVGGNVTNIIFEPGKYPSVRVLKRWKGFKDDSVLTVLVKNDTLYINFNNKYKSINEKDWMQSEVLVRLFAPELLSVDGSNTNFELQKMKQRNININLKGESKLELETYSPDFDTLNVVQSDSSQVTFEMSPNLKVSPMMHFNSVSANMTGYSLLDIGRSYVDHIKLNISDSSAIILSGKSIKANKL